MLRVAIQNKYLTAGQHGCCLFGMYTSHKQLWQPYCWMSLWLQWLSGVEEQSQSSISYIRWAGFYPLVPLTPFSTLPCIALCPRMFTLRDLITRFPCPYASSWVWAIGDTSKRSEDGKKGDINYPPTHYAKPLLAGPQLYHSFTHLPMDTAFRWPLSHR